MKARAPGSRILFFVADGRARYERLVRALSGARQAGAETLAMMPRTASPP
jgi:biopolymer transport protein ExbD